MSEELLIQILRALEQIATATSRLADAAERNDPFLTEKAFADKAHSEVPAKL